LCVLKTDSTASLARIAVLIAIGIMWHCRWSLACTGEGEGHTHIFVKEMINET